MREGQADGTRNASSSPFLLIDEAYPVKLLFFIPQRKRRGRTSTAGAVGAAPASHLFRISPFHPSSPSPQVVSCCSTSRAAWASCQYPRRPKWPTATTTCPWRISSQQPARGREAGRDPCIEGGSPRPPALEELSVGHSSTSGQVVTPSGQVVTPPGAPLLSFSRPPFLRHRTGMGIAK